MEYWNGGKEGLGHGAAHSAELTSATKAGRGRRKRENTKKIISPRRTLRTQRIFDRINPASPYGLYRGEPEDTEEDILDRIKRIDKMENPAQISTGRGSVKTNPACFCFFPFLGPVLSHSSRLTGLF